ncbi:hypothetical protein QTN25_003504 [Entamoeba marina]
MVIGSFKLVSPNADSKALQPRLVTFVGITISFFDLAKHLSPIDFILVGIVIQCVPDFSSKEARKYGISTLNVLQPFIVTDESTSFELIQSLAICVRVDGNISEDTEHV